MSELIERYVHQVGRFLPEKDRTDIQTELRAQIQEQLDDRFGSAPSQSEVASVLAQFGEPRAIARSYAGEQYLVGPELYPIMMMAFRFGLPLVPAVIVLVNVVGALLTGEQTNWILLLISSIINGAQATLIFAAVVVLIFAILQHSGVDLKDKHKAEVFDPLALPPVDDPTAVDRAESAIGIAIGAFLTMAWSYFLAVGGLTTRFNLSDPGEVTPVSRVWLIILVGVMIALIILNLWALLRNRWTLPMWGAQALAELIGAIGLYFVVWTPLFTWLATALPDLRDTLLFDRQPLIFTIVTIAIQGLSNGSKLLRLWKHRGETKAPAAQASGKQSA